MYNIFAKIKTLFGSSRETSDPYRFDTLDFPQVNLDAVADELGVEDKASENGSHDVPVSDATQLDGPQSEIRAKLQGRIRQVVSGYKKRLDGLTNEIRSYDIQSIVTRIKSADEEFEDDLATLESRFNDGISTSKQDLERAEERLSEFKSEHNIKRDPERPDSRWWQTGVILIAGILEAVLNAFFFRQGLEGGVVAGAFVALILAAVDMGVVFHLGRWSVWMVYGRKALHRVVGTLASITFAAWALFYNLLATHVRESLQGDVVMRRALETAWDNFLASPFSIEQADSVVLFFSGLVFSIMALGSGISWNEKIPEFGSIYDKVVEAREELTFWLGEYHNRINSLREEALRSVDDDLNVAREKVITLENLIQTKDTLLTTVDQCVKHHREACRALMKR